jgi:hypothetical protein
LRAVYEHLGESDAVVLHDHDGGHEWDGSRVPVFLERWL